LKLADWLRLARPKQWTKNLLLFAALLFAGRFRELGDWALALQACVAYVFLSASVYALNDARDAESDRRHPQKKSRPVASGRVSPLEALFLSVLWAVIGLTLAGLLGRLSLGLAVGYLALSTLYTHWTKHQVILDVLSLSGGFVLRAAAGAAALAVPISEWLLLCTTLLALFMGLLKRRAELVAVPLGSVGRRRSLEHYSLPLLDQMIAVAASATLVAYALYAFSSRTAERGPWMMLTIPHVIYGIYRYLYLAHQKGLGAEPEKALLSDQGLQWTLFLYVATSALIVWLAPR
jgi:4-hydroxybenzoate polyprenyltransferase